MALQPQIVKLVEKLAELTNQNKITWEATADEDTFLTSAGKSVVTIGRLNGWGEPAGYRIRLLDGSGRVVHEAVATLDLEDALNPTARIAARRTDRDLLQDLHEKARRSALHADEAVADILLSLEQIR